MHKGTNAKKPQNPADFLGEAPKNPLNSAKSASPNSANPSPPPRLPQPAQKTSQLPPNRCFPDVFCKFFSDSHQKFPLFPHFFAFSGVGASVQNETPMRKLLNFSTFEHFCP
jgi:hypothetical protein